MDYGDMTLEESESEYQAQLAEDIEEEKLERIRGIRGIIPTVR